MKIESFEVVWFLNQMVDEYCKALLYRSDIAFTRQRLHDFITTQDIPKRLVEFFYKDETMKCKYCGSTASMDNKFHNVECCLKCYKKGWDKEVSG
ncbi:MAG: hypothetical protein KAU20_05540 [Nanoarchaeota archaeon]|nr:hypothetical protein [Nanoarchaeota archaeon]